MVFYTRFWTNCGSHFVSKLIRIHVQKAYEKQLRFFYIFSLILDARRGVQTWVCTGNGKSGSESCDSHGFFNDYGKISRHRPKRCEIPSELYLNCPQMDPKSFQNGPRTVSKRPPSWCLKRSRVRTSFWDQFWEVLYLNLDSPGTSKSIFSNA